tara:strand:+ start:4463 stop:5362 length:900 start_codon:yes stop_codon:yes gene_type:complete
LFQASTKKIDPLIFSTALFQLMKPRVMSLVIFTCVVGLIIAPNQINLLNSVVSLIAVAVGAGAAGTLNMWYESDLDALMKRTCLRPIPSGKISKNQALIFGVLTAFLSVIVLYISSNLLAASMLAVTILFYVLIYTIWLKRKTPQNIVIGGAAGAFPPIIGWTISTGTLAMEPIILFLIIFFWTPSHFWALSLYKAEDYAKAKIPMLPVISGIRTTKINIFVYSIILFLSALSPYFLGFAGLSYFIISGTLSTYYVYLCYKLLKTNDKVSEDGLAKRIFGYSIIYLFAIFTLILFDKIV